MNSDYKKFLLWQYKDSNRTDTIIENEFKKFYKNIDTDEEFNRIYNEAKKIPLDFKMTVSYYKSKFPNLSNTKLGEKVKEEVRNLRLESLKV
jgi:acyl-ACP thioesterase